MAISGIEGSEASSALVALQSIDMNTQTSVIFNFCAQTHTDTPQLKC